VSDLAQKGHFEKEKRILILHTGGIFPWNNEISG
jgi:1-aminocyclopropane-1-carboxylate deaminase/D-cysteine desulfhydrase-like pyridoxal-dependent ACC family enzyme